MRRSTILNRAPPSRPNAPVATCHCSTCRIKPKTAKPSCSSDCRSKQITPQTHYGADGVSCAVCHQIRSTGPGTSQPNNGNIVVALAWNESAASLRSFRPPSPDNVTRVHVMTTGYTPIAVRPYPRSRLVRQLPHSLYRYTRPRRQAGWPATGADVRTSSGSTAITVTKQTCQQCHMPVVAEPVAVSTVLGQPREGVRRHSFVGANFFMEGILNTHRDELAVTSQPSELAASAAGITSFLQAQSARVTLGSRAARRRSTHLPGAR